MLMCLQVQRAQKLHADRLQVSDWPALEEVRLLACSFFTGLTAGDLAKSAWQECCQRAMVFSSAIAFVMLSLITTMCVTEEHAVTPSLCDPCSRKEVQGQARLHGFKAENTSIDACRPCCCKTGICGRSDQR